jgi:hypothetical protein
MLKALLLSGWFRVQPFLKYVVVAIIVTPMIGVSIHSTLAKQSEVAKVTSGNQESATVTQKITAAGETDLNQGKFDSVPVETSTIGESQLLLADKIQALPKQEPSVEELLAAVKLPLVTDKSVSQNLLVQKLKAAKVKSLPGENNSQVSEDLQNKSLTTAKVIPTVRGTESPSTATEIPTNAQPDDPQAMPADPIGSPHPIPWKWILLTQESIGSKGASGVRYYRSVPVISPDRKYAVYSRVQLEVQPEMYNSRVSSVLFVQDMQTKRLRVMAKTSTVLRDPLLQTAEISQVESETNGTIGVLVPVSWSETGDRFLARKFEGVFNTADATDQAVIWDRQKNYANTVAPAQAENEHEKIAILLGWSKSQPDHVLFRAGELGEEDWPLVKVANDGKSVTVKSDGDQPITFGEKVTEVWGEPQVASR